MENSDLFLRFGAALAIGFLIGLQREFAHGSSERNIIAGERTFALFGLAGALAAMISDELSSEMAFVGIILILGAFITAAINEQNIEELLPIDGSSEGVVTVMGFGIREDSEERLSPPFHEYKPGKTII